MSQGYTFAAEAACNEGPEFIASRPPAVDNMVNAMSAISFYSRAQVSLIRFWKAE